ncbi:MAG TPA: aminotransferase class I/II, partial [Campylobacterales bacterium]|nr:aminotransferase class I/II [Campylobacterales bacterium]
RVIDSFVENNDFIQAFSPEGTYLYWLDFQNSALNKKEISKRIQKAGLALSPGDFFFNGKESLFFRFNFATDRSRVESALNRLKSCF